MRKMNEKVALSGLKVLEYADSISGPYCARLLGDLGAEVIKIERPGSGDSARQRGPFLGDVPGLERSGLFMALNTNKLGGTINIRNPEGLVIFKKLVEWADVLIQNRSIRAMEELNLDYDRLKALNPRLIMTSITPFGQTGPYKDRIGTDLVICQMSGMGHMTPDRVANPQENPPLRLGGNQSDFLAGTTATVATMFAVLAREVNGSGQHVDVSELEALASFMRIEMCAYTHDPYGFYQRYAKRNPTGYGAVGYTPCKDGFVALGCREEYQWRAFMEEVLGPEWTKDKRIEGIFPDPEKWDMYALLAHWDTVRPIVEKWSMQYTRGEIYRIARMRNIPLAPCNSIPDLFASEHLAAREYFVEVDHPVGRLPYPGAPFKLSVTPWTIRRPAPRLGEHTEEILCGILGYSSEEVARLKESGAI